MYALPSPALIGRAHSGGSSWLLVRGGVKRLIDWHSFPHHPGELIELQSAMGLEAVLQLCTAYQPRRSAAQPQQQLTQYRRQQLAADNAITESPFASFASPQWLAYLTALCERGYTGPLCGACLPGYGRARLLECQPCRAVGENTVYYILILGVNVLSLSLTIRAAIMRNQGKSKPPLYSQIIKIFVSFSMVTSLAVRLQVPHDDADFRVNSFVTLRSAAANSNLSAPPDRRRASRLRGPRGWVSCSSPLRRCRAARRCSASTAP